MVERARAVTVQVISRAGQKLVLPLVLLAIWEFVSGWSPLAPGLRQLLPPPTAVVRDAWQLLMTGRLVTDAARSVLRLLGGFCAAAAVGIPVGFAIGLWSLFEETLDPVVEFLRPIPPPAWIPLGILWFGVGDAQNMFILSLGALFPIVLNTIAGVRGVDRTLVWGALTLGASRGQVIREIVVPAAFPLVMTGLRIGLGVAWTALVAAELMAARSGLGFLIQSARYAFVAERILAGMVAIGLLGLAMDSVMRAFERRFLGWRRAFQ
jgi:ABC-type nitrate/sulfonate/bicarbonate transport system permease component